MKQIIDLTEVNLAPSIRSFIDLWKEKKKYPKDNFLSLGHAIELMVATSYTFHKDYSDGRFFDNILISDESLIAWDGKELIDILLFEIIHNIQLRLSRNGTFNEEQP